MRRRPLVRAAMVGGAGYAMGKRAQRGAEHEAEQDAQLAQQQPVAQAPPPQQAAPQPAAMSEAERIDALKKLKDLLDSGVLTQEQFETEKAASPGKLRRRGWLKEPRWAPSN